MIKRKVVVEREETGLKRGRKMRSRSLVSDIYSFKKSTLVLFCFFWGGGLEKGWKKGKERERIFSIFKKMFIYFERERQRRKEQGRGRERGRDRRNLKQSLCCQCES